MKFIRNKAEVQDIDDQSIARAILEIMQMLEDQYEEPYKATLHGWFVICESEQDLIQPFQNLTFSLAEKLNAGEVEFVEKKQEWYEVYILLNDNEGILVYVPKAIFEQHKLKVI
jgi:hypothetical protein